MTRPRVVTVGAGSGGLKAARGLRRADAEVLVIEAQLPTEVRPERTQQPTTEESR
jgi:ribulose 1,5-bisphosphate synthetase/thiazole synthase